MQHFDAETAIIGAGPAGLAAARSLQGSDFLGVEAGLRLTTGHRVTRLGFSKEWEERGCTQDGNSPSGHLRRRYGSWMDRSLTKHPTR